MRALFTVIVLIPGCSGSAGPGAYHATARVSDAGRVDDDAPVSDAASTTPPTITDTGTVQAEPDSQTPADEVPIITVGSPLTAQPAMLVNAPLAQVVPLASGGFVAAGAEHVWIGGGEVPERLDAVVGELRGAYELDGELLVLGDSLHVRVGDTLEVSPLSERAGEIRSATMTTVGGETLWMATDNELLMWRNGLLRGLETDLPTQQARLAATPGTLWVSADGATWTLDTEALVAVEAPDAPIAGDLVVDGDGDAWLADGVLWQLGRTWHEVTLPVRVHSIAIDPLGRHLWLTTDDGLWHLRGGHARPVRGGPEHHALAVETSGAALLVTETSLVRIRPGRFVALAGLRHGAVHSKPFTVELTPDAPDEVEEIVFEIDDAPAPARWIKAPTAIEVVPTELEPGRHALTYLVRYDDGEVVDGRVGFHVRVDRPVAWDNNIEPLMATRCQMCHGAGGSAHRMDDLATWREEIDLIVSAVRDARMPLPPNRPLTPDQVDLLIRWRDGGLLESWP